MGELLNNHMHLTFLRAKTPEGLELQFKQFTIPWKLRSMYHDGKNHIAWIESSERLKIIRLKQEK